MIDRIFRSRLSALALAAAGLVLITTSQLCAQQFPGEFPPLDEAGRAQIVEAVCTDLNDIYVFPDVAEQMCRLLRSNLEGGTYDGLSDVPGFTQRLTEDMRSISHDLHLGVRPYEQPQGLDLSPEERRRMYLERIRAMNYGFRKVEILEGNIGYLELLGFVDASIGGQAAEAAMNLMANVDALIFDLRDNGGGSPSMIQLLFSYLLAEPTHLNSFYIRSTDSLQQFWSHAHVRGQRLDGIPVFVLTSNRTFSAAEEFSYNMKALERGTLVGETTRGGAHPVQGVPHPDLHILVRVPFGRAINPITGTNWEGKGVEPHIAVPAEGALDAAHIEALKTLSQNAADEDAKAWYEILWRQIQAEDNPVELGDDALEEFTGSFEGDGRVFMAGGRLALKVGDEVASQLIPLGNDFFGISNRQSKLRFVRDESGAVVELKVYQGGSLAASYSRVGE